VDLPATIENCVRSNGSGGIDDQMAFIEWNLTFSGSADFYREYLILFTFHREMSIESEP
jgi:hypothetical protein